MVAAEQHRRHRLACDEGGAGVVGMIQQTGNMGILPRRVCMTQGPRQEPDDRIHYHHCRQLTATQYIITDGPFLVHPTGDQPFINPFISTRNQNPATSLSDAGHLPLVQKATLGAQISDTAFWGRGPGVFDRRSQRANLHHHPRPTTIGAVVNGAVDIPRVITRIPQVQFGDA